MAAGLVSHNITTASGVTFAVVSWVPNTAAPDVGAVPVARITDGTSVAPVDPTNGLAVQIIPALPAGTNAIGKLAANSGVNIGTVTVDATQLATLLSTFDTLTNKNGQQVTLATDQPVANKVLAQSNGMTSSRVVAAASTNATSLKASNGAVGEIDVFNAAAYDVFLKFYNKATAPTVGTDTPTWTIPIKAGTGYSRHFPRGKWFATGVAYAITKLQADSDTTVVVAGDLTGTIDWI